MRGKTEAIDPQHDEEKLTFPNLVREDIDAFRRIAEELDRIWGQLMMCANAPDYATIHRIATDIYFVKNESREFAEEAQEDLETLEKEAGKDEQNTVDS